MEKKNEIISFIIISYNRPGDTINVVKNILFFLNDLSGYQKEILVINNDSSIPYNEFESFLEDLSDTERKKVNYFPLKENLGVPKGRNFGMKEASGETMVFIDDDAEFLNKDTISITVEYFQKFEKTKNVKILAFREQVESTGNFNIPTKSKTRITQEEFFSPFYIGCGHAIKKDLIQNIGFYSETSLYGAEEYDLSYRTLNAGFRIFYTSKITVLHRKNPEGRAGNVQTARWMFENKIIIAYQYLPIIFIFSHLALWSGYFLKNSNFSFIELIKTYFHLPSLLKKFPRRPISRATLRYIRSIEGRLWY
jgi:GT2 family glycosyltransferase